MPSVSAAEPSPIGSLVLGPLIRHVGERTASIWVETAAGDTVTVRAAGRSWSAPTFAVLGHHYALVLVDGLEPGSVQDYTVSIGAELVWPEAGSPFPASRIATLDHDRPSKVAFGSCRTSVPHDAEGNRMHGVDALRAYALEMIRDEALHWPDLLVFLGDQVYADETSPRMQEFIASRRSLDEPPGTELKDYTEYAHLYRLAWDDPANRWLLSTLPSLMIFDDHDLRDDWNTSLSWHEEMNAKPWWRERIVGGLASYWVYQHLGNLAPDALAEDPLWRVVQAGRDGDEVDLTADLLALADRADREPTAYRWSYAVDLGDARLVVVDSRAARVLDPGHRSILDPKELAWLDRQLQGGAGHLLIGTSLPFLLPPGLHDFEAMNEAMSEGAWGPRLGALGEKLRQAVDLEHWAAFQEGFADVLDMVMSVARGERGPAPGTITFLSGDVHNSYIAQVRDPVSLGASSRIVQAVCSPIRNPLPRHVRVLQSLMTRGLGAPMRLLAGASSKVPDPQYRWDVTHGPWFDNNLATLEVEDRALRLRWAAGHVDRGADQRDPSLRIVADVWIAPLGGGSGSAQGVTGGRGGSIPA